MKKKKWDTIRILFTHKGFSVKDLSITLVLRVKIKNDYYIGPIVSNDKGIIEVTPQQLELAIKQAQSDYIMDYAANLDECKEVALIIDDIEELKKTVESLAIMHPEKVSELQKLIRKSVNAHYAKLHVNLGLDFKEMINIELRPIRERS
jgi:uncharacterized protein (UPF0371 family)